MGGVHGVPLPLDRLAAALPAPPGGDAAAEAWARWAQGCLDGLPRRWEHVCGMWRQVRRWHAAGLVDGATYGALSRAVLAHDVGYAVDAARHAQVAARALQLAGTDAACVSAVAHHNRSRVLAGRRGFGGDYRTLPACGGLLDDALTLLDATTGPDGQPVTVGARHADVAARYGAGSVEAAEVLAAADQAAAGAAALGVPRDPAQDRTLVVCDLGGVVTSGDGREALAAALAALGVDGAPVVGAWPSVRHRFWSGALSVDGTAGLLCGGLPVDPVALARAWDAGMAAAVGVLDGAAASLEALSAAVPVWVLSNHRSGWLVPVRRELGWLVDRWFVSDRLGTAKPDREAFEVVDAEWRRRCALDGAGGEPRVVYVDDQPRNLEAAAAFGWVGVDGRDPCWADRAGALVAGA